MTAPSPERMLTTSEVAAYYDVDRRTVTRWADSGKLPARRTPGGHRRFSSADVELATFSLDFNRLIAEAHKVADRVVLDACEDGVAATAWKGLACFDATAPTAAEALWRACRKLAAHLAGENPEADVRARMPRGER